MSELHRLQRLEHLAAKFEHKVGNTEKWADGKDEKLSRNDDIESANLAEILVSGYFNLCRAIYPSLRALHFPISYYNYHNICFDKLKT